MSDLTVEEIARLRTGWPTTRDQVLDLLRKTLERAEAAEKKLALIHEHYGFAMARQDVNDIPCCNECGGMRLRPMAGYVAPKHSPDGRFCPNCGERAERAPAGEPKP